MHIGPTAAGVRIQAPPQWGKAKDCPAFGAEAFEESPTLQAGSTHLSRASRPSLRKRSPDSISA
jgi:hypothetical protein